MVDFGYAFGAGNKVILQNALTDQIDDREMFMKGVDHSYEYEGYHSYKTEDLIKNTRNKSKKNG